jgi:hypothetical protein
MPDYMICLEWYLEQIWLPLGVIGFVIEVCLVNRFVGNLSMGPNSCPSNVRRDRFVLFRN